MISTIIVDESHIAKNEDTQLNVAIRSLNIAGQVMLFPNGGPFVNLKHLNELVENPASGNPNELGTRESSTLNMILASFTIGRPKKILRLPPVRHHEVVANLREPFSVIRIEEWTVEGKRLLRYAKATGSRRFAIMGLALLRRAQSEAASPLLHVATNIERPQIAEEIHRRLR
ncbi:hypothetical protein FGADI_4522 [Fusarium gaditjirri]|uniref:SNF2 N-terminal domain-containing protein n=1 Tax=Fusarium gaditjirri TaxID=282569 RepID=A0A8H4WYJ6_9HYPO|nr:hypothetical protein FGADI_4522 [Fusarium gaditjirri]